MAKKSQKPLDSESQDQLEVDIEKASHQVGRPPKDITIIVREMAKMLEAVKMSKIGELAIGSYFVPQEGQLGIEGLVNQAAALMNQYVQAGWQPWQMATPYPGKFSFNLEGRQTGQLEGQWITIIWGKPVEELQ